MQIGAPIWKQSIKWSTQVPFEHLSNGHWDGNWVGDCVGDWVGDCVDGNNGAIFYFKCVFFLNFFFVCKKYVSNFAYYE